MRLERTKMNNDTNIRGKHRSPLKSNPRKPEGTNEGTIMDNMVRILELVEENKRIKNDR